MPSEVWNPFIDHIDVLMTLLFNSGVHCILYVTVFNDFAVCYSVSPSPKKGHGKVSRKRAL